MSRRPTARTRDRLLPTLKDCEDALGEPAAAWVARCHEVASRIVAAGLAKGRATYGHWLGPIDAQSHFASRRGVGFVQHGWVALPDGRVLDPTRWVFEAAEPYLYIGPPDYYDEGGNRLRAALRTPPPPFDPKDRLFFFDAQTLPAPAWRHVETLLRLNLERKAGRKQKPGTLTRAQAFWLANAPLPDLGEHAAAIYEALERRGLDAFIPYDNRQAVRARGAR